MGLKFSLTLRFVLVVALLLSLFSITIYQNYSFYRKNDFKERLADRALSTSKLLLDYGAVDSVVLRIFDDNSIRPLLNQLVCVYDSTGNLVISSGKMSNNSHAELLPRLYREQEISIESGDTTKVGFMFTHHNQKYAILASAADLVGTRKLAFLRQVIIISFIISIFLLTIIGWLFAHQALKPVRKMIAEVDTITAQNLYNRLPRTNSKDEIDLLAGTFNNMLDRLEASFIMQKNFVSNASHEFRTPLTAMKGQIEVMLMQERTAEEYVATLESVKEEIDEFMHLLVALSELANTHVNESKRLSSRFPIIEVIADSRSEILKNRNQYRIELNIENIPEIEDLNYVKGNQSLLKTAIKNLIENACKFSPDQRCQVSLKFEKDIMITVTDDGIGINEDDIAHIFEPFYRSNDSRGITGHGLGLSLVKKIIEMHGGTVSVESKPSKGTKMTVTMPYYS